MKSLQFFLQNFLKNKGQYVFFSLLISKICAFLSSVFIIKWLPPSDFGTMSIVAAVFALFASGSGLGSHQSVLRFGSLAAEKFSKEQLSAYLFRKGLVYQIFLSVIFLVTSIFYIQKYDGILMIFVFFAVRFLGFYFLNFLQSDLRIHFQNREFARLNNVFSIGSLILTLVLAYFFQLYGYLLAVAISPFVSLFWLKKKHFKKLLFPPVFKSKEIWNYAFHASGAALLSDALFSADILLLGFMLNENAVANYRVAIFIPSNVTFLALTFMQSDFPVLAKNYRHRTFLKKYIAGYYRLFIPVCIVIFSVSIFFSTEILKLVFSEEYIEAKWYFVMLMFTFLMNILFRNLYGNLLSAMGKMSLNTYVSLLSLVVLLILALLLVPEYHVLGMAVAVSATLLISGFLLAYFFYKYLKDLK